MHSRGMQSPSTLALACPSPEAGHSVRVVLLPSSADCRSFEQLYAVDFFDESTPSQINDNFQLEVQYAYMNNVGKQRNDYFLIDFVEYERLESFASCIDEDARAAAYLAGRG